MATHQADRLARGQRFPVEIEADGSAATATTAAAIMSRRTRCAVRRRATCRTGLPDMPEITGRDRLENRRGASDVSTCAAAMAAHTAATLAALGSAARLGIGPATSATAAAGVFVAGTPCLSSGGTTDAMRTARPSLAAHLSPSRQRQHERRA
ncbi:hypothetical protein BLM15_25625 [Bosea sp. Tri-49]|nr:hypothetical protein BLM15_25625 [Bosea sp. Tri-49]